MSQLSIEETNKIKKQAITNRRVQEIEKIANKEVEIANFNKLSLLATPDHVQKINQAIVVLKADIEATGKFIVVIDEELKKYE